MLILGIDPGTRTTGYGIIRFDHGTAACVEYGTIENKASLTPWQCHVRIADGIARLVQEYTFDAAAVESQFFFKNPATALRIGEARAAAVLPVSRAGVVVFEYAPARVKQSVVGTGAARKEQVQAMVRTLLGLKEPVAQEDAADALAIALCHAHTKRFDQKVP